ncbi:15109_t:CDS:2, partial [Acaulospora morrowiae]
MSPCEIALKRKQKRTKTFHNAIIRHLQGEDFYMIPDDTELSREACRSFKRGVSFFWYANQDRREMIHSPIYYHYVPPLAPSKTSEDEHDYEVKFNQTVRGTNTRPDFSCHVENVSFLSSEIKPLGCGPLMKIKDTIKVNLRARKSINQQLTSRGGPGESAWLTNFGNVVQTYIMDLKHDAMYGSLPHMTSRLVIDQPSMPLIESSFMHFVDLE